MMSPQETGAPGGSPSADAQRPVYRVAAFGLATRLRKLLEIVLRHARHNRYHYAVATDPAAGAFDIAIVDMTADGGPEIASTLQRALRGRPVIKVGRRSDPQRPRDDLLHSVFVADLLGALNGFVETQLRQPPAVAASRPGWPGPIIENGVTRRPRALVVDDSPTVRRQLAVALGQMGIDSEAVDNAREALDVLRLRRYELCFVDVIMPGIDGFRLTREIKRDPVTRPTSVVILTSRSSPLDLARGALAGCNCYLVKPVSMQSLRETVARQLRRPARRGSDSGLRLA
ncbi:MAG: response regulator [Burkholderiaceae bacterium]